MVNWLDRLSWTPLIIFALFLGVAPISPEPHLVEKTRMLFTGTLSRPIDIFDLFLHGLPIVLIAIKLTRMRTKDTG